MNVLAARLFLALDSERKEVLKWGVFDLDFAIDILNVSQVVPTRANALLLQSIRQHTSAYLSIRQHTQAYASMRSASRANALLLCLRLGCFTASLHCDHNRQASSKEAVARLPE